MTDPHAIRVGDALPPSVAGTVATVGTFDGVHRGHQDVVARLVARGREHGLTSLLVTFEPHPLEVVRPEAAPPLLTLYDEKLEVLTATGLDYLIVVPFTRELAAYEPPRFVELLHDRFRMRRLLMGHDHGFGRNRAGDAELVRALGARMGFAVEVVPAVAAADGTAISSTAIRRAIDAGDLGRASELLGRLYSVAGPVVHGMKRGRLLGYPTLNVELPPSRKLLPPGGVYAVRVQAPRGTYGGMLNLGPRPTFGESTVSMEVHLFEAEGDFYGQRVRVDFAARLRDTRKFDGLDELVAQLTRDAAAARSALAGIR